MHTVSDVRIWPILAAAALLLSGCSAVPAPQPGFTADELADVHEHVLDLRWSWTQLPDERRPPDPEVQVVSDEEWAPFLARCMNEAGFDNYEAVGNGLLIDDVPADEQDASALAFFICESSIRIEGSDRFLLNPQQLDYIYDYYVQMLVPCLALRDVELQDVPTRAEFVDLLGTWNPYWAFSPGSHSRLTNDETLFDECPSQPPGMPDDGLAEAYGH